MPLVIGFFGTDKWCFSRWDEWKGFWCLSWLMSFGILWERVIKELRSPCTQEFLFIISEQSVIKFGYFPGPMSSWLDSSLFVLACTISAVMPLILVSLPTWLEFRCYDGELMSCCFLSRCNCSDPHRSPRISRRWEIWRWERIALDMSADIIPIEHTF